MTSAVKLLSNQTTGADTVDPCRQEKAMKDLAVSVGKIEQNTLNTTNAMIDFINEMRPMVADMRDSSTKQAEVLNQHSDQIDRLFKGQREIKSQIKPLEEFVAVHQGRDKGAKDTRLIISWIFGGMMIILNVVQFFGTGD